MGLLVTIDNGGTLTDVCAVAGNRLYHGKTLTTPHDLSRCFMEALSVISARLYGSADLSRLITDADYIRYSSTQGTNALVERKGPRLGLISNNPTLAKDLQYDTNARDLFQVLVGPRHSCLDLDVDDAALERALTARVNDLTSQGANRLVVAFSGVDFDAAESRFRRLFYRKFPRHLLGAVPIIFSHELVLEEDLVRRGWAAMLNSFLHPTMEHFLYNAEGELRRHKCRNPLLVYRNDGNSTRVARTVALNTYSSGPRGGVEGVKALLHHYQLDHAISMDIGGTTTDVATFADRREDISRHGLVDGIETPLALANIHSIGAGGSSVISVRDGVLQVGPESVGAAPGPLCFGRGGDQPTITDVYLLLGYLDPSSYFGGKLQLDADKARRGIAEKIAAPLGLTLEGALDAMADAYHGKIAGQMKSMLATPDSCLIAFGGAGPMSGCRVADQLGLTKVLIPRMAAVFSAFGIGFSDIASSYQARAPHLDAARLARMLADVRRQAAIGMRAEGFDLADCEMTYELRLDTTAGEQISPLDPDNPPLLSAENDGGGVTLTAVKPIAHYRLAEEAGALAKGAEPIGERHGLFGSLPIYPVEQLAAGQAGQGPALLEEEYFTCVLPKGWGFRVTGNQDIFLEKHAENTGETS